MSCGLLTDYYLSISSVMLNRYLHVGKNTFVLAFSYNRELLKR